MKSYVIEGGKKLNGTIKISGSKNASLPILAATILGNGTSKLYNVPNISDIENTINILKIIGCKIKKNNGKIEVNSQYINKTEIPTDLMSKMRSSVILAGAMLGKFKKVKFSYPGGYDICLE
ncbi:MAG: UDP-N-acetylglucosamine 1-carboxyvinyltransferase [Clostridia bacterium]|nr:UDP-N-acetylglucosamine 1-carboxyvinyltransferase [Clostridia bacterium]